MSPPARTRSRKLALSLLSGLVALCGCLGGATAYALRCDRASYSDRTAASWLNDQERYLFACGQVWHTYDAGQTWARIPTRGLPLLVRDGFIAADRTPGRLYLGLVLATRSTPTCLLCAWTHVQPAMYLSEDGGQHWALVHTFNAGPAGQTQFRAVYADPDYSDAAWTILILGDETGYYATNTGGRFWRKTCVETFSGQCDPPDEFLQWQHINRDVDEGEVGP